MSARFLILAGVLACGLAHAELIRCVPDSPERHGGTGCSTLEDRRLSEQWQEPAALYWHIDEFESLAEARRHAGPTSAAFEAHGRAWLASVGPRTSAHQGGTHRADIGPLVVERGRPLSMMIMSAYFEPEQITTVHVHSGPEAIFVVEGEQCMQLKDSATLTRAGETAIAPSGEVMQLVATGKGPRRALVLVLHDADRPGTALVPEPPALKHCDAR